MAEISEKTGKRRGPGKPFQKGVSGNPGGRPRIENAEALKEALKLHSPRAVDVLVEIMEDAEASASNRLAAASAILDRTFGKPTQTVDSTVRVGSLFDEWVRKNLRDES